MPETGIPLIPRVPGQAREDRREVRRSKVGIDATVPLAPKEPLARCRFPGEAELRLEDDINGGH